MIWQNRGFRGSFVECLEYTVAIGMLNEADVVDIVSDKCMECTGTLHVLTAITSYSLVLTAQEMCTRETRQTDDGT